MNHTPEFHDSDDVIDELLIGKQHLEAECREKQRSIDQLAAENATLRTALKTHGEEAAKLVDKLVENRAAIGELVDVLKDADMFITNGVALGFIRMPEADCPDPAHATPGRIRAAITKHDTSSTTKGQ